MISLTTWLVLGAGLALLLGGGEALVRGSVAVASRLGVSKLLIGLTLVGFGTSMPELVASLQAALAGSPGVAVGNVVGSNIANILLILGISVVILPIATNRQAFTRDGSILVAASLLMLAAVLTGVLGRVAGAVFLVALVAYTIFTYFSEKRSHAASAEMRTAEADLVDLPGMAMTPALLLTAAGIVGVIAGAGLLVTSAIEIATAAGMSEAVIGLTLVAVGTSLPELVTSAMAAIRRQGDVAFGNIVGSNIFNILGIAGVTAVVAPLQIPAQIIALDIWVMLGATGLLVVFAMTGWRLNRWEGAAFIAAYLCYLAVQLSPGVRAAVGLV